QLRGQANQHYLAIVQPLRPDQQPLGAAAVVQDGRTVGVQLGSDDIDDILFFARSDIELTRNDVQFTGRYAAVQRDAQQTVLTLLAGTRLAAGGIEIRATGTT